MRNRRLLTVIVGLLIVRSVSLAASADVSCQDECPCPCSNSQTPPPPPATPGSRGTLHIPYKNYYLSKYNLENFHITITRAPKWFKVLSDSDLGPVTIGPSEIAGTYKFKISYEIGPTFSAKKNFEGIDYTLGETIVSDVRREGPPPLVYQCQIRSRDGFQTYYHSCQFPKGWDNTTITDMWDCRFPDRTPPITKIWSIMQSFSDRRGQVFAMGGENRMKMEADDPNPPYEDNGSGVAFTGYSVDVPVKSLSSMRACAEEWSCTIPDALSEGKHTIYYGSRDKAGNEEAVKSTTIFIDATPPVSWFQVVGPHSVSPDGKISMSESSDIIFEGKDPISHGGASGLSRIFVTMVTTSAENVTEHKLYLSKGKRRLSKDLYEVTFGSTTAGLSTTPYKLSGGSRQILFGAIDNAENQEPEHTLNLFVGTLGSGGK